MSTLRRWQLTRESPLALTVAADARVSATDYTDDQIWELTLGKPDSPALTVQTRYGGRVGLASVIPMWWIDNRPIYQFQAYASPPVVTAFAPGYIEIEAKLTPNIILKADYWAVDSHTLGARYTLKNTRTTPVAIRLDVIAFAAADNQEIKIKRADRLKGDPGVTFDKIASITPVIVLEGGKPVIDSKNAKLTASISIKGGGTAKIRWAHAGLPTLIDGFAAIDALFVKDVWTKALRKINKQAITIPVIETGDLDTDAALAFAYQQVIGSFLDPTMVMPYASFVGTRQPHRGFSPSGDGSDHPRSWSGQTPTLAYLTALATATIDPTLAQGIVHNYLAYLQDEGFVDYKPGLGGQKTGMLCLPILARLSWELYQQTDDLEFLRTVYPKLARFVNRWLRPDLDADKDGFPEWASEQQTGYPFMPTFAVGLGYGQNADIRYVEAPDLASYLLSETIHLRQIAERVGDLALSAKLDTTITSLKTRLEALWNGERYAYRDRDTHHSDASTTVLANGRGDEEHLLSLTLDPPARLILHITGGIDLQPRLILHVQGIDSAGTVVKQTFTTDSFTWSSGRGVHTTDAVFSRVDRVRAEGLSRVYKISIATLDLTRRDISALLPIWSGALSPERAAAVVAQITDTNHFWLPNGITMIDTHDTTFDAIKTGEGGGIWAYWVTLIGEGLLDHGYHQEADDLLRRLMRVQVSVLKTQKSFYEFYHTEQARGLGEEGHTAGLIPLYLFTRVIGVSITSARRVMIGGVFAWGQPITIKQHGVTIKRDQNNTHIEFPSGHTVNLDSSAPFQTILDPTTSSGTTAQMGVET